MKIVHVGHNPAAAVRGPLRLWDCGTTWAHVQPSRTTWVWDKLDDLVEKSSHPTMLVLGHPPEWATNGSDGRQASWLPAGTNLLPRDRDDWDEYVSKVAHRYRGQIAYYQIWNEPADPAFFNDRYDSLVQFAARARKLLHEIDPRCRVVSAPLQPRPASGWPRKARNLMDAYRRHGYPVDAWSVHIYPEEGRGPERWKSMLRGTRTLLRHHEQRDRPLLVTETNYNVPNGPALDPYIASRYHDETLRFAKSAGLAALYWYAAPGAFGIPPDML